MNHVLHIVAIVQIRQDTEGRDYYRRKLAAGKIQMEALRCLKRRLSDVVYRQLVADAARHQQLVGAGPGGHCGATKQSSAADSHPLIDTSDQPLPLLVTTALFDHLVPYDPSGRIHHNRVPTGDAPYLVQMINPRVLDDQAQHSRGFDRPLSLQVCASFSETIARTTCHSFGRNSARRAPHVRQIG